MENNRSWVKYDWLIWNNSWIIPSFTFLVFHYKHVICKMFTKSKLINCTFGFLCICVLNTNILIFHDGFPLPSKYFLSFIVSLIPHIIKNKSKQIIKSK